MDVSKLKFNIYINWSDGKKGMGDGLDGATYKEVGKWIKHYAVLSKKHDVKRFEVRKFEVLDEKGEFVHLDEVLSAEYEWLDTAGKRATRFEAKRHGISETLAECLVIDIVQFLQKLWFAKKEPESATKLKFIPYIEYSGEDGNRYYDGDTGTYENGPVPTSYFAFRKYIDELVGYERRDPGYFSYFNVKQLDIIMPDGTETSVEDVLDGEYEFLAEAAYDRKEASSYPEQILECIDRLAKGQDWFKQKQVKDLKERIAKLEKELKSAKKELAKIENNKE